MKTLREIMARDPVTVGEDMTLREAIEILESAGINGAPVMSGESVVGVMSATDLLEFEASSPGVPPERVEMLEWGEMDSTPTDDDEAPAAYYVERWFDAEGDVFTRVSETDSPEWDRLEEHTVSEIMSRKLVTLPPSATVADAARLMVDLRVNRVLVMIGPTLVGVVTTLDVLAAVAGAEVRAEPVA
jgi:CBS domain-containing protein